MKDARPDDVMIYMEIMWPFVRWFYVFLLVSFAIGISLAFWVIWEVFAKLRRNSAKISRRTYMLHAQFTLLLLLQVRMVFG